MKELGEQISRDYLGKEILLVCVLRGAAVFMADLARHISASTIFDFMAVSSYGTATETSGVVRIVKDLDENITGRDVLLVEDIVDTGLTLSYIRENLRSRRPASLKVCTLLDKPARRSAAVTIDYRGFEIPDRFVVGYGLDYGQRYRNLPFICVLRSAVCGNSPRRQGGNPG